MPLPAVATLTETPGVFVLDNGTRISATGAAVPAARLLAGYLGTAVGTMPEIGEAGQIVLGLTASAGQAASPEEYSLEISEDSVVLSAAHHDGLLRGIQALRQLLPAGALAPGVAARSWKLPCLRILDRPELAWRGFMLDVARHFFPKDDVLRLVDLIALHRLNVLHLHLTDDQGWRLPITRYPRLTEVGSVRREAREGEPGIPEGRASGDYHAGFYTREDIAEILAYAAERGILVVPEIDMPGHVQAAVAAYPELGIDPAPVPEVWPRWGVNDLLLDPTEAVAEFFGNVLAEVMDLFPSPYIHIGGDECPMGRWLADPAICARAAALGLPDATGLHSWFMGRIARFVKAAGRIPVGWDEVAGADPDTVVMTWNAGADPVRVAEAGHPVILTPSDSTYFDLHQAPEGEPRGQKGVITLADAYAFEPRAGRLGTDLRDRVLGAQCQVWTEYIPDRDHLDYMLFPRLCAFAERAWSGGAGDFAEFEIRLERHLDRLAALGVGYRALG